MSDARDLSSKFKVLSDGLERAADDSARDAEHRAAQLDLTSKELKDYSIVKVIEGLIRARENTANPWERAGFEHAISNDLAAKCGRVAPHGGLFIPDSVLTALHQRDLATTPGSAGGYLVDTSNKPGTFIELLRNSARTLEVGVTVLPGLQGNVTIPVVTGGSSLAWLGTEISTAAVSDMTFGQLALSPKTAGGLVKLSRSLLLQSSAELIVYRDLAAAAAVAIDVAVLSGEGVAGQPLGLLNLPGIGAVSGTSLGWSGCLEFQSDVAAQKAMSRRFSYLTTTDVAKLLMGRQRFTNTDSPVWDGNLYDGTVAGFPARSSDNVPTATMIGGDFSQIILASWGPVELTADPFTDFKKGLVALRCWLTIDVAVRQLGAFSVASSIT